MKTNKKVCHITTVHPPFDTRIFHKECKTLAKAGFDVSLIAQQEDLQPKTNNPKQTFSNKQLAIGDKQQVTTIIDGIKIIFLPKPKNRFFRIFFLTKKAYKIALKQKANIYHFHDPELLPWAIKLKKKTGAKIIYDVHEDVARQILGKEWLPDVLRYPILFVYNFFEHISVKFFDIIITAGDDIKFQNSKIIAIKNYPFRAITTEGENALENTTEIFHCIYVGSISKDRCVKEVLQSLDYIKNSVLFTIIGPCEDKKYLQDLKNLIKIQKRHQVKLIPRLPYQKTMEYLKFANVGFVLFKPSPNNIAAVSRNNKLYEYMAFGLPVITSDFPLWKEFVEENKCGICVNPLNPKEIAKAVEYLIEHPEEARKMGKNGRKAVLEKYNWENESKKLLDIYRQLTTGN